MKKFILIFLMLSCTKAIGNVDLKSKDINEDLITAIDQDDEKKFKELISNGASIDYVHNNKTLLKFAIDKPSLKIVKILLENDIKVADEEIIKIYDLSLNNFNSEIIDIMIKKNYHLKENDISDEKYFLLLCYASTAEIVKEFIVRKAISLKEIRDKGCVNGVFVALSRGKTDIIKMLIEEYEADFEYRTYQDYILLLEAHSKGYKESIKLLSDNGVKEISEQELLSIVEKKQSKSEAEKSANDSHQQEGNQISKKKVSVDLHTTSSVISTDLIFNIDNLNDLVIRAINQNTLSNDLYNLRAKKIKDFIGTSIEELCQNNEIKIIEEIIKLSNQLPEQLKSKDNQKLKSVCQKIFSLVYKYIFYRIDGIKTHLDTGNISAFYGKNSIYCSQNWGEIYINCTFKKHKADRLKEIYLYCKKPEVRSVLEILKRLTPALLEKQKSFDEFLLESKNPFSEPGVRFIAPPFTDELNELMKYVELIYLGKYEAETFSNLNYITQKFNAVKGKEHVLELLAKVYTPIECLSFWPQFSKITQYEDQFQLLCLSIGLNFHSIISYDLLEISEEKINQAKKDLERSNISLEDKVKAGRILMYSRIPWYLMRNISALLFRSRSSEDSKEKTIIFQANKDLKSAWQSLLPALQDLITFELSSAKQQINIDPNKYQLLDKSQYLPLIYIGSYAGDQLFLNKISTILGDLDFKSHFFTETYLRLLGILGECAKNLSPHTKKLIGEGYWEKLAKIRDKTVHTTGYLRKMQQILEQNKEFAEALKNELQLLLKQVKNVQQQFPNSWLEIQQFHSQQLNNINKLPSNLGVELDNLEKLLNPILNEKDYKELYSTRQYISTELENTRDLILEVINKEKEAKLIDQSEFFAWVDALYLMTVSKRDKIKEAYKKLRQGKEIKLPSSIIEDLKKIKSLTNEEIDSRIESLIKNFKSYNNANLSENVNPSGKDHYENSLSVLKKDLAKNGLIAAELIWEEKFKKFFNKINNNVTSKKKTLPTKTLNLDKVLTDSIDAAKNVLKHLEELKNLVHKKDSSNILPLEDFCNNPILCHAVEFHFTRLRIYTDIIQEALSYLPRYDVVNETILKLNNLYDSLSIKLKNIRLYGNSLAHLHDITKFDGRTTYGHRFTNYQELYSALKDYKLLSSIKTVTEIYIKLLNERLGKINKDRAIKLEDNIKNYKVAFKWQQQALKRLPNSNNLSDYYILNNFDKIDENDPNKPVKKQLYNATKKLLTLHQEFLNLQNIKPISVSPPSSNNVVNKYADNKGQKLIFEENSVVGDGWCTLNAIGILEPSKAINLLKDHLNDPRIVRYIRNAIENNYQASLGLGEEFDIEGIDNEGNNIKDKITTLDLKCKNNVSSSYQEMLNYFGFPEVQNAYLDYLLKTRYVDSNIAAACLSLQGKKLALFIDYNLPDGKLINMVEDDVLPNDINTVCLVLHPNSRSLLAHYNLLKIVP